MSQQPFWACLHMRLAEKSKKWWTKTICFESLQGHTLSALNLSTYVHPNTKNQSKDLRELQCCSLHMRLAEYSMWCIFECVRKRTMPICTKQVHNSLKWCILSVHDYISKSNCISPAKFFHLFYTKNLLFLFYITTFPKHPHQFIYFTIYSI